MTEEHDDISPYEHEAAGDYDAAAAGYARDGFDNLLRGHFRPSSRTRIGVGLLLQSVSCDRRADNTRRASHVGDICRQLLVDIEASADEPILTGLSIEWRGDVELMLGGSDPIEHYDRAGPYFQSMDWRDERWTDEPDFMHCYWAIQEYITHHDGSLPENPDEMSFTERLDRKRAFARQHPGE